MQILLVAIASLVISSAAIAQSDSENLIQNQPSGYKVGFQAKQGNRVLTEMVPEAESVQNWTEMVTTQVFLGLKTASPQQFRDFMQVQAE